MKSTFTGPLSFKLYLTNNDNTVKEIRRFDTEVDVVDFEYVCEKIKHIFPQVRDKDFTLSWLDKDKDKIVIRSNHELTVAIKFMFEDCKLYVNLRPENQEKPTCKDEEEICYYGMVICDGCNNRVEGFRYKCIECINYDLCSQCEALKLHANHCMIRFPHQIQLSIAQGFLQEIRKFSFIQELLLKLNNMNVQVDNVGCCKGPPKQRDIKVDGTLSSASSDCVIDSFISHNLNAYEAERKEKDKENVTTDKSTKLPAEEIEHTINAVKKLLSNNVISVSSPDTTVKKTEGTEEWTVIDKNDALDSRSASSSVSSSLDNNVEKQVSGLASVASSASKDNPSNQMIYPQLSEKVISEFINTRYHSNPKLQRAFANIIEMGFSHNLEYIAYLLESEDGNINKVLDLLTDK
ncbi:refractory to sigma P [Colletes latitarsis]|uniref:refractory to sigma P n=1 Tax=Colletes latitarsis TaxID=2605962 RepID=UPI0040374EED